MSRVNKTLCPIHCVVFLGESTAKKTCEPGIAAICRNVPENQIFHPSAPCEYEVSAYNLDEIAPVESDGELFTNAVFVFPVVVYVKLLDHQKQEFSQLLTTLLLFSELLPRPSNRNPV